MAVNKDQCAPTLILHGSADEDVPPDQSKLFYTALQRLGVESSLVLYRGAGHSLCARDQMIDAASRVVVHFGDHLQLDPAIVAKVSAMGVSPLAADVTVLRAFYRLRRIPNSLHSAVVHFLSASTLHLLHHCHRSCAILHRWLAMALSGR